MGLAIASWIEAGGFARSYQEFSWLVDKGGQREQEVEVNSGVLETRFPGVTSGAGEHCEVFDDNTNQYLIDQRILIGGMLCFEVIPISSSQARVVHRGTDLCIQHQIAPEVWIVQKSTKVCVRRHRGVHRGTERVCATMPEERRRPESLQFQKGQTRGLTR